VIMGSDGADEIRTGAGADTIHPGSGNDVVYAGEGDDLLEDVPGFMSLMGGGNDTLHGEGGDDRIVVDTGEAGADSLDGGDHAAGDRCTFKAPDTAVNCES
jgi:Ca2+-binding RTX toxin-like protein